METTRFIPDLQKKSNPIIAQYQKIVLATILKRKNIF